MSVIYIYYGAHTLNFTPGIIIMPRQLENDVYSQIAFIALLLVVYLSL